MKTAASVLLTVMAVGVLVVALHAADTKKGGEVTLKGHITCAKCELMQSDKCATVIKVKDTIYYFDPASSKAHHDTICQGGKEGTVTGKVTEKDGKKFIAVSKVEFGK